MKKAVDIQWDTDGDLGALESLPAEIPIPDGIDDDAVSDYISDLTGFCHFGYRLVQE